MTTDITGLETVLRDAVAEFDVARTALHAAAAEPPTNGSIHARVVAQSAYVAAQRRERSARAALIRARRDATPFGLPLNWR